MKNELSTMLFNYGKLSSLERQIIEHLHEKCCDGGYTTLTRDLGRPKSHVSNVRKAVLHLRDLGIVAVSDYGIELRGDWYNSLYYAFNRSINRQE